MNAVPHTHLQVQVSGAYASFTEPAARVERMSYPVMPPSAARGVLHAIYWHPGFDYQIRAIEVLREPRFITVVKNELKEVSRSQIDVEKNRTQRTQELLVDVAYVIHADLEPWTGWPDEHSKHLGKVWQRVQKGSCHTMPYLGVRECPAQFGPRDPDAQPILYSGALGTLTLDVAFEEDPKGSETHPFYHAPGQSELLRWTPRPVFFEARLERGVLRVPPQPDRAGARRRR